MMLSTWSVAFPRHCIISSTSCCGIARTIHSNSSLILRWWCANSHSYRKGQYCTVNLIVATEQYSLGFTSTWSPLSNMASMMLSTSYSSMYSSVSLWFFPDDVCNTSSTSCCGVTSAVHSNSSLILRCWGGHSQSTVTAVLIFLNNKYNNASILHISLRLQDAGSTPHCILKTESLIIITIIITTILSCVLMLKFNNNTP